MTMALTPTTLPRHELVGLEVAVVAASNPDLVGLSGRAVAETTRTIEIGIGTRVGVAADEPPESAADDADTDRHGHGHEYGDDHGHSASTGTDTATEDKDRDEHKHNSADELAVVPKSAATFEWRLPTGETVRTAGERLVARPARRTEHTGDSTWR
jgi:RNase P/RNase MRP subunit p29